ncbi:MAG: antibiotic biosynthesis monooxygenase [Desulfobacterales bacterium]|jgi:quinol monooxygenase YgiN
MIVVSLRIKVPPARQQDLINSARLILGPTRIKPGCISCRIYQDLDEPDALLLVEQWDSRPNLERHFDSDQYRIILSLIEASHPSPEFRISTISKVEGLEAVAAVRRYSNA